MLENPMVMGEEPVADLTCCICDGVIRDGDYGGETSLGVHCQRCEDSGMVVECSNCGQGVDLGSNGVNVNGKCADCGEDDEAKEEEEKKDDGNPNDG
jgi:hypothetical protein